MKALALVTALVALALSAYTLFQLRSRPTARAGTATAFITLEQRGDRCVVTSKTETIYASRGQVISWAIENNCSSEQEVSLVDFTSRGAGKDPLDRPPHSRRVPPNSVRNFVRSVRIAADTGTYAYVIALNGVKQNDPEIIIEF